MRSIWRIFTSEVSLLGYNVVTALLVVGLVLMPSLFTWYNVLACWDVFNNTGNLTVAVANCDEGYESDLFPLEVNVGDKVVAALRENNQIGWVFVDEEDAVDGAASGRYYAAVVIPEGFSRAMLTFAEGDEDAEIVYYTNEKKNAIAPKITGQGADRVSNEINEAFSETVGEIAIALVQSFGNYLDESSASGRVSALTSSAGKAADRVDEVADALSLYRSLAVASQNLLSSSSTLLEGVSDAGAQAVSIAKDGVSDAEETAGSIRSALDKTVNAIDASEASLRKIAESEKERVSKDIEAIVETLQEQRDSVEGQIASYREMLDAMEDDPESSEVAKEALRKAIAQMEALRDSIDKSIEKVEQGAASAVEDVKARAQEAISALDALKAAFEGDLAEGVEALEAEASSLSAAFSSLEQRADGASAGLSAALESATGELSSVESRLSSLESGLRQASSRIRGLVSTIDEALASDDVQKVKDLLSENADVLASELAAPVTVERNAVFPSTSFGSSMFPLYAALALFIGSLLIVVLFKPTVSERVLEEFPEGGKPTQRQQFLGHFGVLAVVSLLQTTNLALGSMFFLQVQVSEPLMFVACLWVSGLVFAFIMYSLVAALSNLGKAIGVILLVVQVTGCGGSYPLAILPDFVQAISSYLPAYHIVNALRAAMFGVYANDYFVEMGIIVAFAVPFLVVCLALIRPLKAFYRFYTNKARSTKLLS